MGAFGNPVVIGEGAIVAAGSLVTPGTKVEPHTLWMGVPAKPALEVDDRLRMVHSGPLQAYLRSVEDYQGPTFRAAE